MLICNNLLAVYKEDGKSLNLSNQLPSIFAEKTWSKNQLQRPTSEILLEIWISILISKNPQNWHVCWDIRILNHFQARWIVQPEFHGHSKPYHHLLMEYHLRIHIRQSVYCFHHYLNFHVDWLPVLETDLVSAFFGGQKRKIRLIIVVK